MKHILDVLCLWITLLLLVDLWTNLLWSFGYWCADHYHKHRRKK